ncbi:flagellar basal body-associated protein FliL [Rheinheimera riviphila]|uniref:Flagellar protein FliL n=1 Tax=Rheinheimera riviphila TaxID=1834037 RepID=A0A437QMD1_9GAMM|nr:flagellar basal body-associated FliL family protein [Rheinheimera riviphila]RVU35696.1 flagellar basal body-associated protein FliL [Rheinheimera riviphila]
MKNLYAVLLLLLSGAALAQDPPAAAPASNKPKIVYYGFDPDIVTNYVTSGQKSLGYVRVTMELMIKDEKFLPMIEHHEPMILNAIVGVFGKEQEDAIKSLTGREEIRLKILKSLNELLTKEIGAAAVQDVLFTKYLYQ